MTTKIKLENPELLNEFLVSEKNLRTTGRGALADSWTISKHIKDISRRVFGLDLEDSNLTGMHLFVSGDNAVVSGANFKDTVSIEALSGREFSAKTHGGVISFKFGDVIEKFKVPVVGVSPKTVPLTFFLNSVAFEIQKISEPRPDFYEEITLNTDLLENLGRPVLPSGEPCLDSQMMDFDTKLPEKPVDLKTNIAKIFVSLL